MTTEATVVAALSSAPAGDRGDLLAHDLRVRTGRVDGLAGPTGTLPAVGTRLTARLDVDRVVPAVGATTGRKVGGEHGADVALVHVHHHSGGPT